MVWNEGKRMRKGDSVIVKVVSDGNCQMLLDLCGICKLDISTDN